MFETRTGDGTYRQQVSTSKSAFTVRNNFLTTPIQSQYRPLAESKSNNGFVTCEPTQLSLYEPIKAWPAKNGSKVTLKSSMRTLLTNTDVSDSRITSQTSVNAAGQDQALSTASITGAQMLSSNELIRNLKLKLGIISNTSLDETNAVTTEEVAVALEQNIAIDKKDVATVVEPKNSRAAQMLKKFNEDLPKPLTKIAVTGNSLNDKAKEYSNKPFAFSKTAITIGRETKTLTQMQIPNQSTTSKCLINTNKYTNKPTNITAGKEVAYKDRSKLTNTTISPRLGKLSQPKFVDEKAKENVRRLKTAVDSARKFNSTKLSNLKPKVTKSKVTNLNKPAANASLKLKTMIFERQNKLTNNFNSNTRGTLSKNVTMAKLKPEPQKTSANNNSTPTQLNSNTLQLPRMNFTVRARNAYLSSKSARSLTATNNNSSFITKGLAECRGIDEFAYHLSKKEKETLRGFDYPMKTVPSRQRALLQNGQRDAYLSERYRSSPPEKYNFPEATSWRIGWFAN